MADNDNIFTISMKILFVAILAIIALIFILPFIVEIVVDFIDFSLLVPFLTIVGVGVIVIIGLVLVGSMWPK